MGEGETISRSGEQREWVAEQIEKGNPWYVGSQFQWAENPSIVPIYGRRYEFFRSSVDRARSRGLDTLRFLDAGCGDGYWLHRLSDDPRLSLFGIDYNPLRVERARSVVPRATILCCDLKESKFEEPFDLILFNQVIEHIEDDIGALRDLRRLLRKGGVLILGTTNEGSWLQERKRRKSPSETDHVHFYTEKEIRGKLCEAGYAVDRTYREAFYPGSDRLFYSLAKRRWGFKLLELLTRLWPGGCTDLYFECHRDDGG